MGRRPDDATYSGGQSMGLVQGKVALVTGGGSGIGRASALLLAREGASVCVADKNLDAAEAVSAELRALGAAALAIKVDVVQQDQVQAMTAAAVERFGKLDCAVNCAGVVARGAVFAEMSDEAWEANISVNLNGLRLCMKYEIARMRATGGSVVNMASGAGLKGSPGRGAYVASKHGVVGATKVAAIDHARERVRVNAICPGLILTPMTKAGVESGMLNIDALCPMGRAGEANEVAEAVVWLCSDRSSFVTGIAMPVDGGYWAW
jgi:NAD(P)-dependent dehydrogenase (short-subunit alcohol dehydrogenase family)